MGRAATLVLAAASRWFGLEIDMMAPWWDMLLCSSSPSIMFSLSVTAIARAFRSRLYLKTAMLLHVCLGILNLVCFFLSIILFIICVQPHSSEQYTVGLLRKGFELVGLWCRAPSYAQCWHPNRCAAERLRAGVTASLRHKCAAIGSLQHKWC